MLTGVKKRGGTPDPLLVENFNALLYFNGPLRVPILLRIRATPPPSLLGNCSAELQHPGFFYILNIKANVVPKKKHAAGTHTRPWHTKTAATLQPRFTLPSALDLCSTSVTF